MEVGEIWVVHTEDVDEYDINIFGVFDSLDQAIEIVHGHLINEALDDDYFENWWRGEYEGPIKKWSLAKKDQELKKEYLDNLEGEIDEKIEKWKNYLDQPLPKKKKEIREVLKKQKGFQWGINFYVFTKTKKY